MRRRVGRRCSFTTALEGRKACLTTSTATLRIAVTGDERIERRIAGIGPAADADLTFRQHRHARDAALLEAVEMRMQRRRAGRINAQSQRLLMSLRSSSRLAPYRLHNQ